MGSTHLWRLAVCSVYVSITHKQSAGACVFVWLLSDRLLVFPGGQNATVLNSQTQDQIYARINNPPPQFPQGKIDAFAGVSSQFSSEDQALKPKGKHKADCDQL